MRRIADEVIQNRPLSDAQTDAVRRAFLMIIRISDEGQFYRTAAQWEAMPPESRETLQRFVNAGLLISGKNSGTVEVAHEALLRTWPLLRGWLEENKEFLLWLRRCQAAVVENEHSGTLLAGKQLEEAERWMESTEEGSPERKLIDASLKARKRRRWFN